jgi:hypothetical protein
LNHTDFRTPVAAVLTLVLAGQAQVFAASAAVELRWNELHDMIYRHTIELTLPGAVTVKGDVAAIREDALVLNIKRTSDAKAFPKGDAVIPRSSVTLLKVESHGKSNWHTPGTVLGVLSGVVLGGYIAGKTASSPGSGIAIFLSSASAISLAGILGGRAIEKTTTTIRVIQ